MSDYYYYIFGVVILVFLIFYAYSYFISRKYKGIDLSAGYKVESIGVFYSALDKPPHQSHGKDSEELGEFINAITPKYPKLIIIAVFLFGLTWIVGNNLLTGSPIEDFKLDTTNLFAGVFIPLFTVGVILCCGLYYVFLMTQKVYLYKKGFIKGNIFKRKSYLYEEVAMIEKRIFYERTRNSVSGGHFWRRRVFYDIQFTNGKTITLAKGHYAWLKVKLEHLKLNIVDND